MNCRFPFREEFAYQRNSLTWTISSPRILNSIKFFGLRHIERRSISRLNTANINTLLRINSLVMAPEPPPPSTWLPERGYDFLETPPPAAVDLWRFNQPYKNKRYKNNKHNLIIIFGNVYKIRIKRAF